MARSYRGKYKATRRKAKPPKAVGAGGSTPRPWKNPTPNSTGTETWGQEYVPLREQRRRRNLNPGPGAETI